MIFFQDPLGLWLHDTDSHGYPAFSRGRYTTHYPIRHSHFQPEFRLHRLLPLDQLHPQRADQQEPQPLSQLAPEDGHREAL